MSEEKPGAPRVIPFRRPDTPDAPAPPLEPSGNVPNPPALVAPAVIGAAQLLDLVRQYLALLGPLSLYVEQTRALAEQLRAGRRPNDADLELIIATAAGDRARVDLIREAYEQLKTLLEARK